MSGVGRGADGGRVGLDCAATDEVAGATNGSAEADEVDVPKAVDPGAPPDVAGLVTDGPV